MAKVRGPLLSLSGRGQIADSIVFGSWRGIPYARQKVIPQNPKTTQQTLTRNVFATIDSLWKRFGPLARAPWDSAVIGRSLTNRNRLIQANLSAMRGEANMQNFVGSPGSGGALAPEAVAAVGGALSNEIDVDVDVSAAPEDWTVTGVTAMAFPDGDPAAALEEFVTEAEDAAAVADAQSNITLTVPQANVLYVVSAWVKWQRPDGATAYGPSITKTATSTA